jgi:hypothetical protein
LAVRRIRSCWITSGDAWLRGRLRHIAVGRAHKNQRVRLLVADAQVHVIDEEGVLLRELSLDPTRDYQPLGKTYTVRDVLRQVSGMSLDKRLVPAEGFEPPTV